MGVSRRIADRVARDFDAEQQADVLDLLAGATRTNWREHESEAGRERLHAALLALAGGDVDGLVAATAEAEVDWRDVLVAAGLASDDWPDRVTAMLGPPR